MDIHNILLCIHTGYDVTNYFLLEVNSFKKRWLRVKVLENSLSEDHEILHAYRGQSGSTNLPNMTSLAFSDRLQNAMYKELCSFKQLLCYFYTCWSWWVSPKDAHNAKTSGFATES